MLLSLLSCTPEQEKNWLQKSVVPIRSIDPEDDVYSDLQPLKEKIGNSRVVLLGEQEHGDGSTYAAKSRLAKFLHYEMDFDVVAFESGFFGVNKAWADYKAGHSSYEEVLDQLYLYSPEIKMCHDFFQTIKSSQSSDSPMSIAGFDNQQITRVAKSDFIPGIDSIISANTIEFSEGELQFFKKTIKELMDSYYNHEIFAEDQRRFFTILKKSKKAFAENGVAPFWIQALDNLKGSAEHAWFFWIDREADMVNNNWRDIQMAQNFLWLLKGPFKGEKIIIWAANGHIIKTDTLFEVETEGYKPAIRQYPMGEVLYDSLGTDLYSIGFTSYEGSYATLKYDQEQADWTFVPEVFLPADSASLEFYLRQIGHAYSFLNFKNESDPWLNNERRMRIWRPDYVSGKLPDIYDGIFFIDKMEPNEKVH